jgi:hypothetical protein
MGTTTELQNVFDSPGALKFLGASVLSFNSNLGIGSGSESTLTVELVEDCDEGDIFQPNIGTVEVGYPVYFDTTTVGATFMFGGVLTNWTKNRSSGGDTFSATVTDPRQLLQNVSVVVDSYLGSPVNGNNNYVNAYAYFEGDVLNGNCAVFGDSFSNERGMPYGKVIEALTAINPTVYAPTGYGYTVNWASLPGGLPEYYRVAGPQTLLQLIQDVCDATGNMFYCYLMPGDIINIGLIDLKVAPTSFSAIIDEFDGYATELSYGQELRNDVTKAVIFGEYQHYLTYINDFKFYFGEDLDTNTGEYYPVVGENGTNNLFWINKKITDLNSQLIVPFANDGPYEFCELELLAAQAGREMWMMYTFCNNAVNGANEFSDLVKTRYTDNSENIKTLLNNLVAAYDATPDPEKKTSLAKNFITRIRSAREANVLQLTQEDQHDLDTIYNFVLNLANTYYGKQFLCPLNEKICGYFGDDFQEKIFSSVPTSAGGWVEQNEPLIGLSDPDLGLFRSDDNRVTSFALFTLDGTTEGDSGTDDTSDASPGEMGEGE